ncbi:MAG TPA: hypothetical protein VK338_05385 [Candidatus Nitrosocosmicus sp.]|nr:hypothetical protein [Candidatus Nitrosocosmicus sp.]
MDNTPVLLAQVVTQIIPTADIGMTAPTFQNIMSFAIRALFIVAGILALFFLLLGAISFITSGGDKEKTEAARNKIMYAALGLILVFVVLGIASLLETVTGIGLGITKSISVPTLGRP